MVAGWGGGPKNNKCHNRGRGGTTVMDVLCGNGGHWVQHRLGPTRLGRQRAHLTGPGVHVGPPDYLRSIGGRELSEIGRETPLGTPHPRASLPPLRWWLTAHPLSRADAGIHATPSSIPDPLCSHRCVSVLPNHYGWSGCKGRGCHRGWWRRCRVRGSTRVRSSAVARLDPHGRMWAGGWGVGYQTAV